MKMVGTINEQIGQMGFKDAAQVRCVTCHHGVKRPETLAARLTRSVEKDGVDGAIANYRKLRERYYGSAAYDFSAGSLTDVAGSLAESKKDYDGAIQLLQLNLEFTPNDAETHLLLGRAQLAKGDKAAAIKSFEKTLELDPENRWAKQQLERAKSGQ
jgi:tetratricopeptide (TPR) repeat protein